MDVSPASASRARPLAAGERRTSTYALVGNPNVGKSVIFHRLTGTYVNVSNYPGTTVEVARANARFERDAQVLDTPGVLALPSRSDDERATMRALLHEDLKALVQVADAKHLRRSLNLTLALAEMGLPLTLALNMSDESKVRGIGTDDVALGKALGIDVVPTVATGGSGIEALSRGVVRARIPQVRTRYPDAIERAVVEAERLIDASIASPPIASRGLAVQFLGGDPEVEAWLGARLESRFRALIELRERAQPADEALSTALARARAHFAETLARAAAVHHAPTAVPMSARVGRLVLHRFWSIPILLAVLFAVYEFVGVFGAQTLVKLTEERLFGGVINPAVTEWVRHVAPWPWLADLVVGEYGLWTMGMTYAIALILPIVTTFFIAFGLLEDSGYFSRLSVLANRLFATIGLNGRAVLPMVLGLGCVTMATLTTRILTTQRERLIATFLMALAIPCSAQLGVVMGMLGGAGFGALLAWSTSLVLTLLAVGWLASKLLKGRRIPLVTELPPLRWPVAANVLKKTAGRLNWYLREVIPLFLIGTLLMFVLDRTGVLPWIVARGEPLVTGWLGLPKEASAAFVMGFLRRDFGATGLFAMGSALSPRQLVVGIITLTLFVPCIASVMMIVKEQGLRIAGLMLAMIVPTAFLIGGIANFALRALGVQ
jgi:ferrous iron transport protein B